MDEGKWEKAPHVICINKIPVKSNKYIIHALVSHKHMCLFFHPRVAAATDQLRLARYPVRQIEGAKWRVYSFKM